MFGSGKHSRSVALAVAYAAALQVYSYAKASGNGGGMDAVVSEMGQRFARKPRKAKTPEVAVKSGEATV